MEEMTQEDGAALAASSQAKAMDRKQANGPPAAGAVSEGTKAGYRATMLAYVVMTYVQVFGYAQVSLHCTT